MSLGHVGAWASSSDWGRWVGMGRASVCQESTCSPGASAHLSEQPETEGLKELGGACASCSTAGKRGEWSMMAGLWRRSGSRPSSPSSPPWGGGFFKGPTMVLGGGVERAGCGSLSPSKHQILSWS